MSDRVIGLIVAIVALAFFASATQLGTPFFADPVGPKTFPYIVAVIAFMAASTMVLFPDADPKWPALATLARLGAAALTLVIYAYALRPFGFLIPTACAACILSYQIKPRPMAALITGISLSIGLFIVFKFGLGLGLFALPR